MMRLLHRRGAPAGHGHLLGVGLHCLVSWLPACRAHLIRVALYILDGLWTPHQTHQSATRNTWSALEAAYCMNCKGSEEHIVHTMHMHCSCSTRHSMAHQQPNLCDAYWVYKHQVGKPWMPALDDTRPTAAAVLLCSKGLQGSVMGMLCQWLRKQCCNAAVVDCTLPTPAGYAGSRQLSDRTPGC
jgi:hypothetical protein